MRRRPFPAHGWLGLFALLCSEYLMFHGIQPAATYFTPMAWTSYILIVDAATCAITGHSQLCEAWRGLLKMAALSIPLWLIFEAYNLQLSNWTYGGLPQSHVQKWFGFGWAFATITPGIFMTAALIDSFDWFKQDSRPIRIGRSAETASIVFGAAASARSSSGAEIHWFVSIRPCVDWLPVSSRSDKLSDPLAFLRGRPRARQTRPVVFVSGRGLDLRLAMGVLELLGSHRLDLYVPDRTAMEDFPDARARLSGFPGICARMLYDVRVRRVAVEPPICHREKIFQIGEMNSCASPNETAACFFSWPWARSPRFCLANCLPRNSIFRRTRIQPSS